MNLLKLILVFVLYSSLSAATWWDESVSGNHWKFKNDEVKRATQRFRKENKQMVNRIKETHGEIVIVSKKIDDVLKAFEKHKRLFEDFMEEQKGRVDSLKTVIKENESELLQISFNLEKMERIESVSNEVLDSLSDTTSNLLILAMENNPERANAVNSIFSDQSVSLRGAIKSIEKLREGLTNNVFNKEMLKSSGFFKSLAKVNVKVTERLNEIKDMMSDASIGVEELWRKISVKWNQLKRKSGLYY